MIFTRMDILLSLITENLFNYVCNMNSLGWIDYFHVENL